MPKRKAQPFDPAELLSTPRAMATFMSDALETGDPAFVAAALGVVARAKGMTEISRQTGVTRESLYRALSADGNPEFSTVLKVVRALGLNLKATPA